MPTSSGRRSGVSSSPNAHRTSVPAALSLAKILVLGVTRLPLLRAAPASLREVVTVDGGEEPKSASDPGLWLYLTFAVILVLLGGIFAGLTIALMGQDDVNLQVIHASGDGSEKHHAGSVLRLLKRGKHWVLVTLLLGNVITNETLPIVLDRSLGGGWPAVLSSTALIVIFGEIIPQSICVRYGLRIGAWMSPLVLVLMYVLAPVAWPTAKLLDRMLGEDHGTIYKKAGLKTLVTLHRTLGTSASERLNQDEVTIISAVLDLKDKSVGSIMTPMEDVFTLSADTVLDEKMMENVLSAGYSRIPIHEPENPSNFLGMLLVKTLITYDPEDAERVGNFALATLPETRPETCCLDIVNFFQEGKSHMVLVSDRPGQDHGAIGVVTLEDVIEELIGEEIIDESDVYIDVHRAVRRKDVAPGIQIAEIHAGGRKKHQDNDTEDTATDRSQDEDESRDADQGEDKGRPPLQKMETGASFRSDDAVKAHAKNMRSTREGNLNRGSLSDLRGQSKFGPSNLASQPRQTRYTTVVIKDAKDAKDTKDAKDGGRRQPEDANRTQSEVSAGGRSGTTPSYAAGRQMRDAFRSFRSGYGSFLHARSSEASGTSNKGLKATVNPSMSQDSAAAPDQTDASTPQVEVTLQGRQGSHSTLNSLPGGDGDGADRSFLRPRRVTKSGSITENVVETGGVRKVVLELTSGSEDSDTVSNSPADEATAAGGDGRGRDDGADGGSYGTTNGGEAEESTTQDASAGGKKKNKNRRRKRRNDNNSNSNGNGGPSASGDAREDEPLLGRRED